MRIKIEKKRKEKEKKTQTGELEEQVKEMTIR